VRRPASPEGSVVEKVWKRVLRREESLERLLVVKDAECVAEEKVVLAEIAALEAKKKPSTSRTLIMLPTVLARKFCCLFVPMEAQSARPAYMLRWDEVIEVLLYWNKKGGVVPVRIAANRRVLDSEIVLEVADQMIEACFMGWLLRRRTRARARARQKLRKQAFGVERFNLMSQLGDAASRKAQQAFVDRPEQLTDHENKVLAAARRIDDRNGGLASASQILARLMVREVLRPMQLEEIQARGIKQQREAEKNRLSHEALTRFIEMEGVEREKEVKTSQDWTLWHADIQLVHVIQKELGDAGVLALDIEAQQTLLKHGEVAPLVEKLFGREQLNSLLTQGFEALLRMTCDMHDIDHGEHLTDLSDDHILTILADATIRAKGHWSAAGVLTGLRAGDGIRAAGDPLGEALKIRKAVEQARIVAEQKAAENTALVEQIAATQRQMAHLKAEQDLLRAEFTNNSLASISSSHKKYEDKTLTSSVGGRRVGTPNTTIKMKLPGAPDSPERDPTTPEAHTLTQDEAIAMREASKEAALKLERDAGVAPIQLSAAPEVDEAALQISLSVKRAEVDRLQRLLAKATQEEAHAKMLQGAGIASKQDEEARQARIDATKKRKESAEQHLNAASASTAAAMGIGAAAKARRRAPPPP